MRLLILAVGSRQPAWVQAVFEDYAARMPADWSMSLKEIRPEPRTTGRTVPQMLSAEAQRIRQAIPARAPVIALDERGQAKTSQAFAQLLLRSQDTASELVFLIGGPDGLCPDLRAQSALSLRLSDMTLPHGMARVVLAEQLYRAWSILAKHPYHRV